MKKLTIIIFLLSNLQIFGQIGGETVFPFLQLSTSGNYGAMGGFVPSVNIAGPNSVASNPALIDTLDHLSAAINMVSYVADIHYGSTFFSTRVRNTMITAGMQFIDYGDFVFTDETANELGNFTCRDMLASTSLSHDFGPIRFGISVKYIFSKMETYRASGVAMDLGFLYVSTFRGLQFGFTIMNFGTQIKTYNDEKEKLPLDLRFGITKTLEHAPMRFSFTMHNLNNPKLAESFWESFADHFILSAEIFPEGVVGIRGGFNFLTHNELRVAESTPFPGFSFGLDIRLKRFSLQYSRQSLSPAGGVNLFGVELFLGKFLVR